ncbi:N-acetyltransferase [Pseudolysobacter antarcticus]|uniref:N-acetyltransferase n=1 Tax=Pseudolysobacter antarcticus TaxID=2511995 RepID=A0A411HF94_9GAMM|nr:GNAT family protein [Pseudolysobacter antarcticus]QBB69156.1 N-acetyltransferase [Pseudolysobacter antarcticus]
MAEMHNEHGQSIGDTVTWSMRNPPERISLVGRYCRLEPLDSERHAEALFGVLNAEAAAANWTYLAHEPPREFAAYSARLADLQLSRDPLHFAITDADGRAIGTASYLRIDPGNGSIEVGHLNFSAQLQRTPAATEAMFLLMQYAFDKLAYRRYEWKCDSLNAPSRAAASRLGFRFEGVFRQALVYKGRNRDTAWYSIIDREWPALKAAFERWLAPTNFDADGRQRETLGALKAACVIDA